MAAAQRGGIGGDMRPAFAAASGLVLLLPAPAAAALPGAELGLAWALPFAGLLLSIALLPLLAPRFWHDRHGLVAAAWSLAFLLPCALVYGPGATLGTVLHILAVEYVPFMTLLFALFVIASGIRVHGLFTGSAASNAAALAGGAALASLAGTTGACMVLIRPLLDANAWRTRRAHLVVFFIFLVGNIGGALTPLGDPPLFVGFLYGVDFFWPTRHLLLPTLAVALPLLAGFYALDALLMRREDAGPPMREKFRLEGGGNLLLLALVPAVVLATGVWTPSAKWILPIDEVLRVAALLGLAGLSLALTPRVIRVENGFTRFPIAEVAKLFFGIFVTLAPVIAVLQEAEAGTLRALVSLVRDEQGQPVDHVFFWLTGLLSSVLDNVPTYIVFFNLAGGDAATLMGKLAPTLAAISAGAVFMGALTYIGNAPNLLVVAIAEERGVPVPSFLGYLFWSVPILLPLFALVAWVFF
jgi:Na+/H+ antiporter NhaD/arsenite permease-like protein